MNKQAILFLSAIITLSCLHGCTLPYHVTVDAISNQHAGRQTYFLQPGSKNISEDDLQFNEYAAYVHYALAKRGFTPAESIEQANVAIFLRYGMGDPEEFQYTYSSPTFGQTGISSSYTTGTLTSYGTYTGLTTHTPTYGVTGSTTRTKTMVFYTGHIVLDAIDLDEYRRTKEIVQLWKTTVEGADKTGDLRRMFPVLVAASQQYIATNVAERILVKIQETDERVINIKGIISKK